MAAGRYANAAVPDASATSVATGAHVVESRLASTWTWRPAPPAIVTVSVARGAQVITLGPVIVSAPDTAGSTTPYTGADGPDGKRERSWAVALGANL